MKYNWGPSIIIDPLDIFHKTKLYQKIFFMSALIQTVLYLSRHALLDALKRSVLVNSDDLY